MNLQEELKALKERVAELEEQEQKEQEFPKMGDIYWRIDDRGSVDNCMYNNYYTDNHRQSIGNMFRTEEQAEFAVEKLKVEAELRKFSTNFVLYKENWFLSLADTRKDVRPLYEHRNDTQGVIYFESREKAEEAMDTVSEERIKKYIFGVED